jgi:hypothetical protein
MADPATLLYPLLRALGMLAWVPLIALVHEAGHAALARPAGFRVTSFGVGRGRPLFRFRGPGGVVVAVRLWFFAGGACVAIPRGPGPKARAALFHAGGVFAQLALAALLALNDAAWSDQVAQFNGLVLAFNLFPWRVGGFASDGWWIVSHLRAGRSGGPGLLFSRRAELARLVAWEEQIGSPVGTWYGLLLMAWMDLQVRRLDAADAFFTREHVEAVLDPHLDALHHALVAEWHRLRGRPLAALWVIRQLRAARGDALPPETEDLLGLVEGRTWLDLGEIDRARACLARLAGVSGTASADATVLALEIAVEEEEPTEILRSLRRVRLRSGSLDPAAVVVAVLAAAKALDEVDAAAAGLARAEIRAFRDRLLGVAGADDAVALNDAFNAANPLRTLAEA